MVQASVGFQCPECAKGGSQKVYNAQTIHRLNQPVITIGLIAVNVAVFLLDQVLPKPVCGGFTAVQQWGGLFARGEFCDGSGRGVASGEWWRIVSSGFVHFGVTHLALNMLALWIVGSQLERALGRWRFLGLYTTSLLAGSLAVLALGSANAVAAGASGAIFGLFGVAFVYQRSLGIDPWRSGLGAIIGLNLIISFTIPGISWAGHIGGLIGGAAAALLVFELEKRIKSQYVALGVCAALSVAFFALAIVAAQNPIVN